VFAKPRATRLQSDVQSGCFGARIPETSQTSNKNENAADEIVSEEII